MMESFAICFYDLTRIIKLGTMLLKLIKYKNGNKEILNRAVAISLAGIFNLCSLYLIFITNN